MMKNIGLILRIIAALCAMAVASASAAPESRDGGRDFDFNLGTWHTHISRLLHPLTGSNSWVTYDGTVTVRPVWGGAANLEEIEADGPSHLELLNVRMYNKQTHQWSLNGVNSAEAVIGDPMYGSFSGDVGTFYDQESFDGHLILVRQRFFDITSQSYSFEQAFSDDDGNTWEPNFLAKLTRISATAPSEGSATVADTSHDFDFNYGTWATHIKTPDTVYDGVVKIRKIWNGRAFLEEIKATSSSGGFEGLTLFLYDRQSHQWSQTYASRSTAVFERSMVGTFHDGRGELSAFPSENDGKMELVREVWSNILPDTHHFEIQYSDDGGTTWSPAFVAALKRIGPGL
jgi:hypothetical protein